MRSTGCRNHAFGCGWIPQGFAPRIVCTTIAVALVKSGRGTRRVDIRGGVVDQRKDLAVPLTILVVAGIVIFVVVVVVLNQMS